MKIAVLILLLFSSFSTNAYKFIVYYNPVARFVKAVREALIFGRVTDIKFVLLMLVVAIILVIVGRIYFNKHIKKIAEHF